MEHQGDILVFSTIRPVISEVDAVIHTAFDHDFSRYAENCAVDGHFLAQLTKELEGSDERLIATSATTVTGKNEVSFERDIANERVPRSQSENFLAFAEKEIKTSVIWLPPSVHGAGDTAFIPALIALARERGVSKYIDSGENKWPATHRLDVAKLFCDVLDQAQPSLRYHASAESGIRFREIAEAIGMGLDVPVESVTNEEADLHFGWLAMFASTNMPASSELTKHLTGWEPQELDLIEDMQGQFYFD